MRRSSLIPPSSEETSDPFEHLVATITHQSSLSIASYSATNHLELRPLPPTISYTAHDSFGVDRSEQKAFKHTGITCFNPGSFSNDSTFAACRPCIQEVELSALES